MIREIIFEKTGNFWIDNGIVGLYKVLRSNKTEEYHIELTSSHLKVETTNEFINLVDILNKAKDYVEATYLKKTDGAGWIFKDGIFEIYRKTDFKMHLKPFFVGKTPSTEGALLVPTAKDNEIGRKGRKMTEDEFLQFEEFRSKNSPILINNKKVSLQGKGFINTAPQYNIGENFSEDFLKKGKKSCFFSGKSFSKTSMITGMNYPFLTGESGELNFASQLSGKPQISSLYSFVSLFSFYNLNYLLQEDFKNYFLLYDGNLKELSSFYTTISKDLSQLKNIDFCSFETEIIGTVYDAECFFNFLLSIYKQVRGRIKKDERKGILFSKRVFSMSNDGNIFKDVKEYTSLESLFELFDAYESNGTEQNYLDYFINFIRFFNKRLDSGKYDTTWRNRICEDIIYFRSIHKTVEWFMGEVKMKEETGNIIFLDKIIEIYNLKTQQNMKEEMVTICKKVGNRIGAYCREKDDKGILFSIRNAKSRTEFLNVLAETQFRTEISYEEAFFKELPETAQWEEYKALVSIFAMNSFLFKEKKGNI